MTRPAGSGPPPRSNKHSPENRCLLGGGRLKSTEDRLGGGLERDCVSIISGQTPASAVMHPGPVAGGGPA